MNDCKFGESNHYGPCCFTHAEDRPLLECIRALEAALEAKDEGAQVMHDRIFEWKKRAEAAEARAKALEACHRTCDDGHEVGCPLSPSSAPAQPCRGEVLFLNAEAPTPLGITRPARALASPPPRRSASIALEEHDDACPPKKPAEACPYYPDGVHRYWRGKCCCTAAEPREGA